MQEVIRNGIVGGVAALLLLFACHFWRRVYLWLVLVPVALGAFLALDMLQVSWLPGILADVPWLSALILLVWTVQARAGWVRVSGWPAAVALAAVGGDLLVATGLAVSEPDPARRARLVVAASGASLIGPLGGGATLILGPGGPSLWALGLALALVGLVGGKPGLSITGPVEGGPVGGWRTLLGKAWLPPVVAALAAWMAILGGGLEGVADGLEELPWWLPGQERLVVAAGGLLLGMLGDEGGMAMVARAALERAMGLDISTRIPGADGTWAWDAVRVGLSVGGTLPLLFLTKSRMKTGLPLWLLQILLAAAWCLYS